ncbi:MAG: UDP-N-acetylmuramoyl-L-alanyl-D-glutamate--2,6-diaminopimelate ligase [Acidimicrobiia bacterium]|nr:UDP-N-acetylmuramoyl-L-alanyl-D-glutamate--2,6-diaminopimelate ligase [Acidimicrobiia bacterium]
MSNSPVTLDQLAAVGAGRVVGDGSVRIVDVTHDSRAAGPDDLFVAVRGEKVDGHDFVDTATAAAVCVEESVSTTIPQLVVADTRAALPLLAAEVHGHPSRHMQVVGITGTNGKTTVAHLVAAIVEAAGEVAGVVGTVGARIGAEQLPLERTSPEASDFQRLLRKMVDAGVRTAAVEVSSHAVVYGRTAATDFAVVAFTNLSQDHLDFHGDMETYFAAKASLFAKTTGIAVINTDDEWGKRLADMVAMPFLRVGTDGDFSAEELATGLAESTFQLRTPEGSYPVRLPMGGRFNVENALMAAACTHAAGYSAESIASGLSSAAPAPGRMEAVVVEDGPLVIVDYAHTPNGIEQVLQSVAPLVDGRVIVVVGAGGDRDAAKRPEMGRAASQADLLFITSDNPRSEDPEVIIAAVAAGADGPAEVRIIEDRRRAIAEAMHTGEIGDAILILGKGHELGQEIAGVVHPFDDRAVARDVAGVR